MHYETNIQEIDGLNLTKYINAYDLTILTYKIQHYKEGTVPAIGIYTHTYMYKVGERYSFKPIQLLLDL